MTIHKKLFRDLLENKGANIAAIIVIAIGIMLFNGSAKTMDDILASKEAFYNQANFPDAYASVIAAPINFDKSIGKIDNIKLFEGRMRADVKVLNTDKVLRLISKTKNLGKYTIIEGREPDNSKYEILLGNKFAKANNYKIGDSISVVSKGNVVNLKICGFARAAEQIFTIKDESDLFPNPVEFGLAFLDVEIMKSITSENSFNEIIFKFEQNTDFDDVKNNIDKKIENYGIISLYSRDDQYSNSIVDGELDELKTSMVFMPSIFLMVAGLVMSIMIKRIIEQQRGQIGILKALGYSNFAVSFHYASYSIVLGILGGLFGSIAGMFFANVFLNMYIDMFNMQFLDKFPIYEYFIRGTRLSVIFCIIMGLLSSRKAMTLQPAEAMRPEAPKSGQKSIIERYKIFTYIFNSKGKMAIRNIVRNKKRSIFIIIGLSLAFAISTMPLNMIIMMDDMILDKFENIEKYDAKITTTNLTLKNKGKDEIKHFKGINYSEEMLSIPVKLKFNGIVQDVEVLGIENNSKLYKIIDSNKNPIEISSSGIFLASRLAQNLGVKIGDSILLKSVYAKHKKDEISVKVNGIVDQFVGINGYMDITFLSNILGYKGVFNKILISTDKEETIKLINLEYEDSNKIKTVQSKLEAMRQVQHRMSTMKSTMFFMTFISMIMGFAIVYNIYIVVILERKREFATLMVLGMEQKDIMSIISLEQWISAFLGILLGIPIAKGLIIFMAISFSSDSFSMPSYIDVTSLLAASVLMIISIVLAQLLASKKIFDIDMVDALKSAE